MEGIGNGSGVAIAMYYVKEGNEGATSSIKVTHRRRTAVVRVLSERGGRGCSWTLSPQEGGKSQKKVIEELQRNCVFKVFTNFFPTDKNRQQSESSLAHSVDEKNLLIPWTPPQARRGVWTPLPLGPWGGGGGPKPALT